MEDDLQQLAYQCDLELEQRELIEMEIMYKPYLQFMEIENV